ncbi:DarT ssDNA thymidine ADP-ribosyltransferase family protein [Pseudomonas sp. DC3000-4b1]|uniref:DarT ssDNA thymidine ADP-ribosyltransferase family protein n=1 Tax=unclassified Pseudomonas TaxID=196821 RepID=UPI003CF102E9
MTIIYYQLLIVCTIIIVRIFAKNYLTALCVAWSGFTIFNVFISPLLLLQFITIWGTFSLVVSRERNTATTKVGETDSAGTFTSTQPLESKPSMSQARLKPSDIIGLPPKKPTAPTKSSKNIVHESLRAAGLVLKDSTEALALQSELQKATSLLSNSIGAERIKVEAALKQANNALEEEKRREQMDLKKLAYYEEAHDRFSRLLREHGKQGEDRNIPDVAPPDFTIPPRHINEKLADSIEQRINSLYRERETFLSEVAKQLGKNERLIEIFEERLSNMGANEVWGAILLKVRAQDSSPKLMRFSDILNPMADKSAHLPATIPPELQKYVRARKIKARVEEIELPYLVHFTQVENLPSIMKHGICPIATMNDQHISHIANDKLRLDGHPDASSFSIAHPNDKMFASYRWANKERNWVVLIIDRSALWTLNAAFCKHNAADGRIRLVDLEGLKTESAFAAMFTPLVGLPVREADSLKPYDPTDVQAEVLIFDIVEPEMIKGMVFNQARVLEQYKKHVGDRQALINVEGKGFFSARSYARITGWSC